MPGRGGRSQRLAPLAAGRPFRYGSGMRRTLAAVTLFAVATAAQDAAVARTAAAPAAVVPDVPAPDVPVGKAERIVPAGPVALTVYTWRPEHWDGQRMLFVMHGTLRNADEYRDHAIALGERIGALVVAPKFDAERFPSRAYQFGGVLREDGSAAPPADWTYTRLREVAAAICAATGRPSKLYVIGHSAGGQFLVRCAAFDDLGAERIVAANPGSVLLPTTSLPFGYGFGKLPEELRSDERLKAYLAAPLTLYLGTGDDHPDEYFDTSRNAMEQGSGRHQRGLALWWSAKLLAAQHGWPCNWRLVEAVGIGHDHEQMFAQPECEAALFGTTAPTPAAK